MNCKVLVVTVPGATDRQEMMRENMKAVGVPFDFIRSPPPEQVNGNYMTGMYDRPGGDITDSNYLQRCRSCLEGHSKALYYFITRYKQPHLVVLEDDVVPLVGFRKSLLTLIAHAKQLDSWDAINLFDRKYGWNEGPEPRTSGPRKKEATRLLYSGIYGWGSLGYLYNRTGRLQKLYHGYAFARVPVDMWLRNHWDTFDMFTAKTPLLSFSDKPSLMCPTRPYAPDQIEQCGLAPQTD